MLLILIIVLATWFVLMIRSAIIEYKYYQSVKFLEPEIWQQLGAPKFFKIPLAFVSPKGASMLKKASNKTVIDLAKKHRQAGLYFLVYVVFVLLISILYLKLA